VDFSQDSKADFNRDSRVDFNRDFEADFSRGFGAASDRASDSAGDDSSRSPAASARLLEVHDASERCAAEERERASQCSADVLAGKTFASSRDHAVVRGSR